MPRCLGAGPARYACLRRGRAALRANRSESCRGRSSSACRPFSGRNRRRRSHPSRCGRCASLSTPRWVVVIAPETEHPHRSATARLTTTSDDLRGALVITPSASRLRDAQRHVHCASTPIDRGSEPGRVSAPRLTGSPAPVWSLSRSSVTRPGCHVLIRYSRVMDRAFDRVRDATAGRPGAPARFEAGFDRHHLSARRLQESAVQPAAGRGVVHRARAGARPARTGTGGRRSCGGHAGDHGSRGSRQEPARRPVRASP